MVVAPAKAGRREWIGLAMLALPTLLVSMDLTVLHLAVPDLSEDLRPSSTQLLWIVDIYGFMIAGWMVTAGTVGDHIGRRRLLLYGAAAFAGASVLAAFSHSAEMLIVTRGLLGIAGATLMPSTMALIRNMFHDEVQRSRAIGIWMTSFMVGATLGPLVGGALLDAFWWGAVFLMGVPVMVLLLVFGPKLLPEYRTDDAGRVDFVSALLSLIAVLAVVYGIKQIAEQGPTPVAAAVIVAGALAGWAFVRRQRAGADPLLDLALFSTARFNIAIVALLLNSGVMMGINFFAAQYLQLVHGLPPLEAGLWTLPMTLAGIPVALLTPSVARHVRPAFVMAFGLLVAAVGFGIITQVDATGLAVLVTGTVVLFVGLAAMGVLGTDMAVSAAPPERAGSASAVTSTGNELGGALGLAILGSIGSAVYRDGIAGSDLGALPADATESAGESLGGAVRAAAELPQQLSGDLLDTARAAFLDSLHAVALTCAVVVTVLAVAVAILLRNTGRRTGPEDPSQASPETAKDIGLPSQAPADDDASHADHPVNQPQTTG
ncbi:MFS transporter [Streptomyces sp. NBC_01351]|uniref:MFS transporter n=1 Tax=Streptomyces sp. NBC_01351 TaxID=2903833 RepID=UPI002E37E5E4|nr:MFS transporter [Streptomyces sp. NBC_01351]